MARIELRVDDFEDGVVPQVCASSGAPADGLFRFRASRGALWPLLLLLAGPIGIVAMIVVVQLLRGHVDGWLPLSDAAHDATRAARRQALRRLAEVLAGAVAVVGFLVWQQWWSAAVVAVLIGAVALGYCVATVFRPAGSLGVRWSRGGRTVIIDDASERFVAAYREQEARRIRRRLDQVADRAG